MSDKTVSVGAMLRIYAISYVGGVVLVALIYWLVEKYFHISAENASMGVLLPGLFTIVTLLITAPLLVLSAKFGPLGDVLASAQLHGESVMFLGVMAGILILVPFLATRVGFGLGVRQGLKLARTRG